MHSYSKDGKRVNQAGNDECERIATFRELHQELITFVGKVGDTLRKKDFSAKNIQMLSIEYEALKRYVDATYNYDLIKSFCEYRNIGKKEGSKNG